MKERVQKLMAQANVASRRAAEEMIEQGRVRINGQVAKLGDQADPATDTIVVDGRRLRFDQLEKVYIAVYKPRNVVSTSEGHHGDERRTVRQLVPREGHLFTIGRLDVDSEGLMVLTNDGDLANKLSHPRYQHTKTYRVIVNGLPSVETLERWQNGVELPPDESGKDGGMTAPAYVRLTKGGTERSTLQVVMTEGKKRQIRRVALLLGHPVRQLVRTQIGRLELGDLKPGEWKDLTARDVKMLSTAAPELKLIKDRKRKVRATEARRARFRKPSTDASETGADSPRRIPSQRGRPAPRGADGERRARRTTNDGKPDAGRETPRRPQKRRSSPKER